MPEQLKNRMQLFEVTPPPAAWQKIAERLDDDIRYAGISGRLQEYEVFPPTGVWTRVLEGIAETPPASIQKKKFPVLFRIAIAAAVTGILFGLWMLNRQPAAVNTLPVAGGKPQPSPQQRAAAPVTPRESAAPEIAVLNTPVKTPPAAGTASPKEVATADEERILKYAAASALPVAAEYTIIIPATPIKDGNGSVIRNMDMLTSGGNYLIISGPNGHLTRISSKFANMIRYLNNEGGVEENLDRVIRESGAWKKRFMLWRKIISESGFIPSSANFLDIAEFKDLAADSQ